MSGAGPCAACGRELRCAKRVIDGRRYCATCAKRLLRRIPCARCGKVTTWPKAGADVPLCPVCRVGDRTCVRCGRAGRPVGLVLPSGVACAACAPYLKPAGTCAYCGATSHKLARRPGLGLSDPACPKCQRAREGHATCPACGKSRRLVADGCGRTVCKRCALHPGPFVCPQCGREGAPHSKSRCVACYWRAHGRRKAEATAAALALTWSRELYLACAADLLDRTDDPRRIALRVPWHGRCFAWLEERFAGPDALSGPALLEALGADGLRRRGAVLGWLDGRRLLARPEEAALLAHSERRRQEIVLAAAANAWHAPLLARYHAALLDTAHAWRERGWTGDHARMSPRTVTAALRSAARFLDGLETERFAALPPVDSIRQLRQDDLRRFGLTHRGYRASLGGFVAFLNRDVKRFGRLQPLDSRTRLRPELLIGWEERRRLLAEWLAPDDGDARRALTGLLLLAFGVRPHQLARLTPQHLARDHDTLLLTLPGPDRTPLPLPAPVAAVADAWLAERRPADSPWLFPGRDPARPLHPASHTAPLRDRGLRAPKLFASALYHLFLTGSLNNPRLLADTLGIALPTGTKYFQVTGAADTWQIDAFVRDRRGGQTP